MLIVGERINTSRKAVEPAVKNRDADFIQNEARCQVDNGATYIDVNAGTLISEEPEALMWLVQTVQAAVDVPLCIDSPNPAAIEAALKVHKGQSLVNSITAEKDRYNAIVPLVKEYGCKVVALCMDDSGMPETAEDRFKIACTLVEKLVQDGIEKDRIYIDPLVRPISIGTDFANVVLDTLEKIVVRLEGVHTICGLSNISFGLPVRKLLNRTFLIMAMTCGLDTAILDPTDRELMSFVIAARTLLGKDEFCMDYITAQREGKLSF
jgi:cobalamin-dependent methionine synthase I